MNLVVGATGNVGGEVCRLLVEAGQRVRALVRESSTPERVEALRLLGAELVTGDLKDKASLERACQGVRTVFSTASVTGGGREGDSLARVDLQGQLDLVDTARAARVAHFIYVSYSGNIEVDSPLHTAKRGVEKKLRESGLGYTILRPSVFMETWLSPAVGFDYGSGQVQILGDGDQKLSWISARDVARYAVRALSSPMAINAVIELGGPEALSPNEVVRIFEEETGRDLQVSRVPSDALEAQWQGAEDPIQKTFAALMLAVSRGDVIDESDAVEVMDVPRTSVREYARAVAGS